MRKGKREGQRWGECEKVREGEDDRKSDKRRARKWERRIE